VTSGSTRAGTAFDEYVVVDWSASARPRTGRDSVWIATARRSAGRLAVRVENPATRHQATRQLARWLSASVERRARVLVGWDFPHGYPSGLAAALGLPAPAWRAIWRELGRLLVDAPDNANNRWAVAGALNGRLGGGGPFWNRPPATIDQAIPARAPRFPYRSAPGPLLAEYRCAERRLRDAGLLVQSAWKLFTTGSVGSQALVGIPRVAALRCDPRLAPVSRVWPFETGFTEHPAPRRGPRIVHAEIWPGIIPIASDLRAVEPRDRAQVLGLARHLARLDAAATLGRLFDCPAGLPGETVAACVDEEGWILGA
jgi:hypothetical protein